MLENSLIYVVFPFDEELEYSWNSVILQSIFINILYCNEDGLIIITYNHYMVMQDMISFSVDNDVEDLVGRFRIAVKKFPNACTLYKYDDGKWMSCLLIIVIEIIWAIYPYWQAREDNKFYMEWWNSIYSNQQWASEIKILRIYTHVLAWNDGVPSEIPFFVILS